MEREISVSMEPIRIGFIGAGPRANSLANQMIFNPNMDERILPTCVLDKNPEALINWRYRVNENGLFTSFEQMLKYDELDAVMILTPPQTHAQFAEDCLTAGLDVWSEVPMGLTNDELFRIIDAEKSNKGNGSYFYGENYCYAPKIQFIAEKHAKGKIGEVYFTEGEYCHSVEHYMIEENYLKLLDDNTPDLDPEIHSNTKPTWRADFPPIKYGHHTGPLFYVLNRNRSNTPEIPLEVSGMGNMKIQKRFNTDNFQICLCKTNKETVCKFTAAFVMAHHGRNFHSFWATQGLYETEYYRPNHYYLEVPDEKKHYPHRHEVEGKFLTEEELNAEKIRTRQGGHGGSDVLMLELWIENLEQRQKMDISAVEGAEWTAIGICAEKAIKTGKIIKIPDFR